MIELPDKRKCYNLPEQVAQNLRNITFLAEQYKNIDALPAIWKVYKEEFDSEMETFEGWTTTFEGWNNTLSTYLANMSSAAVGAIAGQNIAPANVAATGNITADSIIDNMSGYAGAIASNISADVTLTPIFAGAVKNGNKVTFCLFAKISVASGSVISNLYDFTIPTAVGQKLYPITFAGSSQRLDTKSIYFAVDNFTGVNVPMWINKISNNTLRIGGYLGGLTTNTDYIFRFECTFLLSDPLNS